MLMHVDVKITWQNNQIWAVALLSLLNKPEFPVEVLCMKNVFLLCTEYVILYIRQLAFHKLILWHFCLTFLTISCEYIPGKVLLNSTCMFWLRVASFLLWRQGKTKYLKLY